MIWYSLPVQRDWTKLFQISIIGAAVICGAYPVFAEEETREDTKQQIYLSQMAKYPALSKEFSKEIEATAHPCPAPSEGENLFLWQQEDYQKLNKEFADTFAQNAAPRPAPAASKDIYLWQLEDYKELDKTFYNEHRVEF